MCLSNIQRITPAEDITCWKVLKVNGDTLVSLFYDEYEWQIGCLQKASVHDDFCEGFTTLGYGFFHTFITEKDAQTCCDALSINATAAPCMVIAKCIIPHDDECYIGDSHMDPCTFKSFASRSLKIINIYQYVPL